MLHIFEANKNICTTFQIKFQQKTQRKVKIIDHLDFYKGTILCYKKIQKSKFKLKMIKSGIGKTKNLS